MKRLLLTFSLLVCLLPVGTAAAATSIAGKVTAIGNSSFTIQTPGPAVGVVAALNRAADRVTRADYPYVYGGGHGQAGIASVGIKGPGYNGKRVGYDCSGSVAAVLSGAGLWPSGAGVPNDAGIISELQTRGLVAPGAGTGPVEVTLYDDPGVHIFMNIDGRFFGTSDGGGGGNRRGGAGWLDDGAPDATSRVYRRYHVVASALRQSTSAGRSVTFQAGEIGSLLAGLQLGENVNITYRQTRAGTLVASAIAYPGAITTTGVVGSVAPNGSSFTLQTPAGATVTLNAGALSRLVQALVMGDTVQVTYTKDATGLTLHALTVTVPVSSTTGNPAGAPGDAGSSSPGGGSPGGGNGWSGGGNGWSGNQ